MKIVFIYALCEPGTRAVRYLGKTDNLARRFKAHCRYSIKQNSPLGEWLRSLSSPPNMITLCETSEAFWQDDETLYIRNARMLGMPIVNSTDGGEGFVGVRTPEMRAKASAATKKRWADPAYREYTNKTVRAACSTPEAKAEYARITKEQWDDPKIRATRTVALQAARSTPESKANTSVASKHQWATPGNREKRALSMKLKWQDPEYKAKHRAGLIASHAARKANKNMKGPPLET